MGNCISNNSKINNQSLNQSFNPLGHNLHAISNTEPVGFSLKQFETGVTSDPNQYNDASSRKREKAVIIETNSQLMPDDRQDQSRSEKISEHTIKLNPTQSIILDSYGDLGASLIHRKGDSGVDLEASLINKIDAGNADSLHFMKFINEQSGKVVNTRPSGEFYQVIGAKGLLRRA